MVAKAAPEVGESVPSHGNSTLGPTALGDAVAVAEECLGSRIEEDGPGDVDPPCRPGIQLGEQRLSGLLKLPLGSFAQGGIRSGEGARDNNRG